MKKVLVIGGTPTPTWSSVERIPAPGETILGGRFLMNPGGKGANQAVAAARLGGEVTFVAKVGDDLFGREARALFAKEGIRTDYVPDGRERAVWRRADHGRRQGRGTASRSLPARTGALRPGDIAVARDAIETAGVLLMQLETPVDTVLCAAQWAAAKGVPVILNPRRPGRCRPNCSRASA